MCVCVYVWVGGVGMCVVHIVELMCVYDSVSSSLQVTGICFLKQKIIVGGWSRQLAMYRCVCGEVCVWRGVCVERCAEGVCLPETEKKQPLAALES